MARLIDADEAIPTLEGLTEQVQTEGATLVKALVFAALKSRSVIPTVDAVPLDKLCEWLGEVAIVRCRKCVYKCCEGGICSSADHWKKEITEWMEGLDAKAETNT